MRDSDYVLNEIIKSINESLENVEHRLINGNIYHMEDYKYNLGFRYALSGLRDAIKELHKGE